MANALSTGVLVGVTIAVVVSFIFLVRLGLAGLALQERRLKERRSKNLFSCEGSGSDTDALFVNPFDVEYNLNPVIWARRLSPFYRPKTLPDPSLTLSVASSVNASVVATRATGPSDTQVIS